MRDYLLAIDLEATCWGSRHTPDGAAQSIHNMEIIEIGCALANREGEVLGSRSFLVRPTRNPVLSDFCTELTGITQEMVDAAPNRSLTVNLRQNHHDPPINIQRLTLTE